MPIAKLVSFVEGLTNVADKNLTEDQTVSEVKGLMKELISTDDWLPDQYAKPHPEYYQQYLLYCDPQQRFSVVSFVWGPGQKTPVHDHTVWGVIGMLRGIEYSQRYAYNDNNKFIAGERTIMNPGDIEMVSPSMGDIHEVSNGLDNQVSISIHVYGANIGEVSRHVYALPSGEKKTFISGYANSEAPDILA